MMEQSPGIGDLHPREDIQRKSALFVSLEKIPIHLAEAVNEVLVMPWMQPAEACTVPSLTAPCLHLSLLMLYGKQFPSQHLITVL